MQTIAQLLDQKGHDVWSVSPDSTVLEALSVLAEKRIGALLVMEEDRLVGICSERDYARKVILEGRSSRNTPVREIMTAAVLCGRPQQTVEECMALMTDRRIRHLPIVEGNDAEGEDVVGVISIGDLVKAIIAEQAFVIEQLEHYIHG